MQQCSNIPTSLANKDYYGSVNDQWLAGPDISFHGHNRSRGSSSRTQWSIEATDANVSNFDPIHVLLHADLLLLLVDTSDVSNYFPWCY